MSPLFILCAVSSVLGTNAWVVRADEVFRPQTVGELPGGTKPDQFVRVVGSRVAWADYSVLRRDFPDLRPKSDTEIRNWILENFSFISREQLKLNGIRHTPFPVDESQKRMGNRPSAYHRAAIFETGTGTGLVDLKGIGNPAGSTNIKDQLKEFERTKSSAQKLDELRTLDHSDGLMSLGEAVAETSRQNGTQRIFDLENAAKKTRLQTVESYFIISLPVEIIKDNEKKIPAAIYGRQAHFGRIVGLNFSKKLIDDPNGNQSTRMGAAVDFGAVMIRDSRLKSSFEELPGAEKLDSQNSKPWAYGHDAARNFVAGDEKAIEKHISKMLEPVDRDWRKLSVAKNLEKFSVSGVGGEKPIPLLENLDQALRSGDEELGRRVMLVLHDVSPQKTIPFIEFGLKSRHEEVQFQAARLLKRVSGKQGIALIEKAFQTGTRDAKRLALEALKKRTEPEVELLLKKVSTNKKEIPDIRKWAAEQLEKLPSERRVAACVVKKLKPF